MSSSLPQSDGFTNYVESRHLYLGAKISSANSKMGSAGGTCMFTGSLSPF